MAARAKEANAMARYILVIHTDEAAWASKSPAEKQAVYDAQEPFVDRLKAIGGTVRGGAELHPSATARIVRPGGTGPTDGPFAESVEQLGGFLDVECDDLDGLVEAAALLTTTGESVEIRRVMTDDERDDEVS